MDEMKLKLRTNFMRGIVAKLLTKAISKKLGFKPKIQLNEIDVEKDGDKIHLHIDLDADVSEIDLLKITRLIEEES